MHIDYVLHQHYTILEWKKKKKNPITWNQLAVGFNSPIPFFLEVTSSNLLTVVVREPDTTKKRFYQFAL
jgi:hypothetical protein